MPSRFSLVVLATLVMGAGLGWASALAASPSTTASSPGTRASRRKAKEGEAANKANKAKTAKKRKEERKPSPATAPATSARASRVRKPPASPRDRGGGLDEEDGRTGPDNADSTSEAPTRASGGDGSTADPGPADPAGDPGPGMSGNASSSSGGVLPPGKPTKTKVYSFGAMDVEGKLKTPQLLYFLNRVKAELDMSAPAERSFMKELERTADDPSL